MLKNLLLQTTAAVFGASLLFSPAMIAAEKAEPTGKLAGADEKFVNKAAQGGMLEVRLGELAQQKGKRDDVKKFGQMMATDHGKANEDLKKVAMSKGINLPDQLDATHAGKVDKLSKLEGDQFDRAYIDDMVKDHKEDVSEFEAASKKVKDPEIKAFIDRTLPVLRTHLSHVQGIDKGDASKAKKQ